MPVPVASVADMPTLLVHNAEMLVTMDGQRREIAGGGLFATDGWITGENSHDL